MLRPVERDVRSPTGAGQRRQAGGARPVAARRVQLQRVQRPERPARPARAALQPPRRSLALAQARAQYAARGHNTLIPSEYRTERPTPAMDVSHLTR